MSLRIVLPCADAFGRRAIAHQAADRGQEVAVGVFGVDAAFDRPALELHVVLLDRELFAGGDADHLLDEVEAGDEFGHRMLDLQARVHFEEEEIAVLVDDEFDRARAFVFHGLGQRHGLRAHGGARLLVEEGRRRFFDHLLMAALDRAFALAQMDDVAVLVAQHLDFDVARLGDVFFDEQAVVAERGLRFVLRGLDRLRQFGFGHGRCAGPCRRRRPRP